MELSLISYRKCQRRKWNPFGSAPSLFTSLMFYAITAVTSLTRFPLYLQNSCLGTTPALHPQPPEHPLNFLALREAGYSWGHGFLCFPLSSRGWHHTRAFMTKVGRWGESSFLFPSTPFRSFLLLFSWENPTPLRHCHLYLPYFPIIPSIIYHFSPWFTDFILTNKHSQPSISISWSAYILWFKR